MGELAMGAVDFCPLVVDGDDLGDLVGQQAVHGIAPRDVVFELSGGPAAPPAMGPHLAEFQLGARPPKAPARVCCPVE